MWTIPGPEIDAWLRSGGTVVAASDRAARAVRAAYHRARRAAGLSAWVAPEILNWESFVRMEWERRASDDRLVLNTAQEQSLWARIIAESGQTAGWLEASRRRLADLAIEAHGLLCTYTPDLLRLAARRNWQQDAAAFSQWIASFDSLCARTAVLSASRLPLDLLDRINHDRTPRRPLLLAGFDRLLPVQQKLLDAWGDWRLIEPGLKAAEVRSFCAADEHLELAACARWCHSQLDADPNSRLLVIVQDASQRRGEISRAFLKHAGDRPAPLIEFSLGVPLASVGLVRAAMLLLRWLHDSIEENEVDWLFASGYGAASSEETAALQACMRALRRRGLQRTRWTLEAYLRQPAAPAAAMVSWTQRMSAAQQRLQKVLNSLQSPLEWAGTASHLLQAMAWPDSRRLTSAEFQAATRWQQAVDLCGSLGFDGRRVSWREFVNELDRIAHELLFAEESLDAPILIAGPAESAGLTADGIWFLGADENTLPMRGSTHPLLPLDVQRNSAMPHASPALDWELSESITMRLLRSAPRVCFSYARQRNDVEARPSRLVVQQAGMPQPIPAKLTPDPDPMPVSIPFEDDVAIPLPSVPARKSAAQLSLFDDTGTRRELNPAYDVPGGSMVLTSQSQCAFKGFAVARLGAQDWEFAEAGLTAAQRGQFLHAVLHSVWSETTEGIRSWAQLQNLGADLRSFVEHHVHGVLEREIPSSARDKMPARYLELEEQRVVRVVTEWLDFERTRVPFDIAATEIATEATITGLSLKLRLDRVDRLNDGSLLVIDYKTGNVSPSAWELPRPSDVQLPLYAGFALPAGQELGGLVFAKIRPGERGFVGKVANAQATLDHSLNGTSGLMKDPLTPAHLSAWREAIEKLARDFIDGRADVNPREYPETCKGCGLYALCRVREREDRHQPEEEELAAEAVDE